MKLLEKLAKDVYRVRSKDGKWYRFIGTRKSFKPCESCGQYHFWWIVLEETEDMAEIWSPEVQWFPAAIFDTDEDANAWLAENTPISILHLGGAAT